ncbi:MAG: hypothetical protein LIO75_07925 [Lachnospiraceae bacterium]|nr:hypothetical protein [Lachnospiraceae bacterium]
MFKGRKSRVLAWFLSVAVIFSFMVMPVYADADTDTGVTAETGESTSETDAEDETSSAADVWDGSVATGFAGGTGTEEDPYLIATGAQLAYLSVQVREGTTYEDCYFQLSADIDLNDTEFMPIGGKKSDDTIMPFKGNFDGNGHTISNLKITVVEDDGTLYFSAFNKQYATHGDMKLGLFGYTYGDLENFTINNVDVDGTLLNGTLSNGGSGGAAAAVLGNTKSSAQKMSDIHVTGDVSIAGNKFVGGIMGYNGTGVTYTDCSVSGNVTITGNCYVGGIVGGGICNSSYNTTFTNCSVGSETSSVQISGYYCVGGISGAVESSGDSTSYTYLTNCSVIGGVSGSHITCLKHSDSTADSTNTVSNYFVGGLSGKFGWGSGNYVIDGCTVEIDVNGSGAYHSGHQETSVINTDHLDVGAAFVGYSTCTGTIKDTSYTGNTSVAYAFKQYSNDEITQTNVTINTYVASIGDEKYTSLNAAVSAVEEGQIIKLIASEVEVAAAITVSGSVEIDLNGNTLTASATLFKVADGGSLTITDSSEDESGTINISTDSASTVCFASGAGSGSTVAIDSGAINVTSTGGKAVLIWNASVDISGGAFTVSGTGSAHGIYAKAGTITGGTLKVTADGNAVSANTLVSSSVSGMMYGGTYNVSPESYLLASGYAVETNSDGTYTVVDKNVVTVTIDGETTYYTSILSALAAANAAASDATITLIADIDLATSLTVKNTSSKTVTLDLNGYTITTATESFNGNSVLFIKTPFTLTDTSDEGYGSIVVESATLVNVIENYTDGGSTVTLSGGAISFTSTRGNAATAVIKNGSSGTVVMEDGAAITAAKSSADSSYSGTKSMVGISSESGTITLNGGTITVGCGIGDATGISSSSSYLASVTVADGAAIDVSSSAGNASGIFCACVDMSGGSVKATSTSDSGTAYGIYGKADGDGNSSSVSDGTVTVSGSTESCISGTIELTGGTYSHANVSNWAAEGYAVYSNADGTYTVASENVAAKIEDSESTTYYEMLAAAVAAANEGDTVTLLNNVALDSCVTISNSANITLDLNGKTISQSDDFSGSWIVAVNDQLTIKDSSEEQSGSIVADNYYGILVNGYGYTSGTTKLTVESGTIKNNYTSVSYASAIRTQYGDVSMAGGTLSGLYGIYATYSSTIEVSSGTVSATTCGVGIYTSSTLNMSGGTINNSSYGVYVSGSSTADITGGTISAGSYGIYIYNGSVNVSGESTSITGDGTGTITASGYGYVGYGIYVASVTATTSAGITVADAAITGKTSGIVLSTSAGTLTVNSGVITGTDEYGILVYNTGATATVNGGAITGGRIGICSAGTTTITGGIITGQINSAEEYKVNTAIYAYTYAYDVSGYTWGTFIVSGGHFSSEIDSDYCADGYLPYTETSGTYYDANVPYTVQAFTLGISTDSTTTVSAAMADGYGTSTIYVKISGSYIGEEGYYSTSAYPTTSLTFTETTTNEEGGETTTAHNYIFAGWYSYDADTEAYTAMTSFPELTTAYAKFVDADVLKVLCVYTPASLSSKNKAALRFFSSMDSLDCTEFGFVVNDTSTYNCTGYEEYYTIQNSSMTRKFTSKDISASANYLMTYLIYEDELDEQYSVYAYWVTGDGTKVCGAVLTFAPSSSATGSTVYGDD